MENFKSYKKQLQSTLSKLEKFDHDKLDHDYKELKKAFDITYDDNIFALYNVDQTKADKYKLELFTQLCKISGTLAFLGIQILAANSIMTKRAYSKKEQFFNKKCGIAINHLRAPRTIVTGKKVKGGFILNGKLTWASGYKIFDTLLIGFHCDGHEYESMAKFKAQDGFIVGKPEKTFVGFGLHTIDIQLKDFFIKDKHIVSQMPMGTYTKAKSLSKTVHFCIYGIGNSATNYIQDKEFKASSIKKLKKIKKEFVSSKDPKYLDSLRIELFVLVQDIITTGMILNGGSSILSAKKLQRLYRELIMFNSNGLNLTLKDLFKHKKI